MLKPDPLRRDFLLNNSSTSVFLNYHFLVELLGFVLDIQKRVEFVGFDLDELIFEFDPVVIQEELLPEQVGFIDFFLFLLERNVDFEVVVLRFLMGQLLDVLENGRHDFVEASLEGSVFIH